ncbi:HD domain-containing protein [Pseudomonas frederiksbergensis]|uniref:HD domain-containing protein n=1 Tax=Pseudomonas frederiksbergensis TaxID=104087 RepID=UPI003D1F2CF4
MSQLTRLEQRAFEALDLPAFPLNLREIRGNVEKLLQEVQRYGFFDEYTSHGFDHVVGMLNTAQWVIPAKTLEELSSGDCLFITLAIYFHDIGLLISRHEYSQKGSNPEYKRYISDLSVQTPSNIEFWDKVNKLAPEPKEKLLYQEFVRSTHGARVKSWIEGVPLDDDEASAEVRSIIQGLIGKLNPVARRDLALVCESHTADDIGDTSKYKVNRPYGNSPGEEVNLQYAAVILRTVDLLQITNLRAPSVLYQIISPTDPISQIEWQKQGAVRSIRPAPGRDREGKASGDVPSDTIEVHARFEKSDGFFGLTSYLAYARTQLTSCQEALKKSERSLVTPPLFPWKFIDDSSVEADGFLTEPFGFELDQQKILDLLTGHTLYNDTDVVIRELTQNALDAIRLQAKIDSVDSSGFGEIRITWNSVSRVLEVIDNGTGMSQAVIEDHLLKVGSSRYQDPKFREKYPEFSSISRFGIGVLSAFMVADSVQITTCSPEDEKARQISLRSVHGKYLIKLLDKISDRPDIGVWPNGSKVKLTLRPTADIGDVLQIAQTWLLFPRCNVIVKIDDEAEIKVGFKTPKDALETYIKQPEFLARRRKATYKVQEVEEKGVTLAYVVVNDELFNDWSFVQIDNDREVSPESPNTPGMATCVEGVGVEFTTPGFKNQHILAIANLVGKGAPKTNVARSALEDTAEYRESLRTIYKLYSQHITKEVGRLSSTSEYSLSRAVEQAPYIALPLTSPQAEAAKPIYLGEELAHVPFVLLEENNKRRSISITELGALPTFWTVNSPLTSSVEYFVREAPNDICASVILDSLRDGSSSFPSGVTMCNFGKAKHVEDAIRIKFEPVMIEADQTARRLTVKWEKINPGSARWINASALFYSLYTIDRRMWSVLAERNDYGRSRDNGETFFSIGEVDVKNLDGFGEFSSNGQNYLHPADPVSKFFKDIWLSEIPTRIQALSACTSLMGMIRKVHVPRHAIAAEWLEKLISNTGLDAFSSFIDFPGFMEAVSKSESKRFDPFAWKRRGTQEYEGE